MLIIWNPREFVKKESEKEEGEEFLAGQQRLKKKKKKKKNEALSGFAATAYAKAVGERVKVSGHTGLYQI